VRRACIDIGSNTTRLLVADVAAGALREVEQHRVFTHVRRGLRSDGSIGPDKIAELIAIVRAQLDRACELGAEPVVVVATAVVRRAPNAAELAEAVRSACGAELRVLSEHEEARFAFAGACGAVRAAGITGGGELGVADVGGGSSELVVGAPPDHVRWWRSLPVGSGDLAEECFRSDPPSEMELDRARRHVAAALEGADVPRPVRAVAVGGSAASLRRLAGGRLDEAAFGLALDLLRSRPSADVAAQFDLARERVRLLPAGLIILQAAQAGFGVPLDLVGGGLREGVLMEMARA
jgi:exopolyphosphatase/guanosine-5'-triphosphate,3'-diphosphate pyrophosphatase